MKEDVWKSQEITDRGIILTEVSPFGGDEILIRFKCQKCNEWVSLSEILPSPNFNYDRMSESEGIEDIWIFCIQCDEEHHGEIINQVGGMLIQIEDISPENIYFRIVDNEPFKIFKENLNKLSRLSSFIIDIKVDKEEIFESEDEDFWIKERLLYNICFINSVTVLESFLSDELKGFINQYNKQIRQLEGNYNWLSKNKMNISQKGIEKISFHNVNTIRKFFNNFLGVPMPANISTISSIVNKRHDLVHRNGKTIDGMSFTISHKELTDAIEEINIFGTKIHVELNARFGT